MIKNNLRRVLSMLSAMIIMLCSTVPLVVSADDTASGVESLYFLKALSYMRDRLPNFDDYDYFCATLYRSDGNPPWYEYSFVVIANLTDDYISLGDKEYDVVIGCSVSVSVKGTTPSGAPLLEASCDSYSGSWDFATHSDYVRTSYSFDSYCAFRATKKVMYNGSDFPLSESFGLSAPITMTITPEVSLNMQNKIYYPSKGGANGDSNGLVEDENYNLAVKLKLTDDFLKTTAVQNGYLEYSYQYTCFIVPSMYKDSDIKTMSSHAVYTACTKSQFLYSGNETLDINSDNVSDNETGVDTSKDVKNQWANADGLTNCFYIPRDGGTSSTSVVNIDLHTIDWASYYYASYNIVVLSHVIRKTEYGWTAYPYYFTTKCADLAKESKKEYPIAAKKDDPTDYDEVVLYDYYTLVSDDFSLKDIPEYIQQTCGGTTVDQKSPLDYNNQAETVQDYELWQTGEKKNPSDFDDYKKNKELAEVPKNKLCKRNNRQISDNTKIAAKQGNAEERPDAGCEIKRWKTAAEMSSFFNIPPDISKADKPQGFGDRVPDSRQAANLSSKYIAN